MSLREGGIDKGDAQQSSRSRLHTTTSRSASRSLLPSSSSRSFSVSSKGPSSGSPSRSQSKSGSHKSPSLSVSLEKKPQCSQHNVHQNVSSTSLKGKLEHPTSPKGILCLRALN
ncbi:serine/arginine-rich splicing factor 4-like [Iris pallida]|uniref:Serine/arginine-rich splicing factor 4-like n=1 Tax=Iris pallida TaxID=29817 RepID=A0AAX6I4E8_IRIPA|nr:serine/arginine-rich splicing factor 4-like [Iris pallida]